MVKEEPLEMQYMMEVAAWVVVVLSGQLGVN